MSLAVDSEIERAAGTEARSETDQRGLRVREVAQHSVTGDEIEVAAGLPRKVPIRQVGDEKGDRLADADGALEPPRERDGARAEIHGDDLRLGQAPAHDEGFRARAAARDEDAFRSRAAGATDGLEPFEWWDGAALAGNLGEVGGGIRMAFVDLAGALGGGHTGMMGDGGGRSTVLRFGVVVQGVTVGVLGIAD